MIAYLLDPEGVVERECETSEVTQDSVALTYALAMRGEDNGRPVDWRRINSAIAKRWPKGLPRVKTKAWKLREAQK